MNYPHPNLQYLTPSRNNAGNNVGNNNVVGGILKARQLVDLTNVLSEVELENTIGDHSANGNSVNVSPNVVLPDISVHDINL